MPKVPVRVTSIRIPTTMRRQLTRIAKERFMTRTGLILEIIREWLAARKETK